MLLGTSDESVEHKLWTFVNEST